MTYPPCLIKKSYTEVLRQRNSKHRFKKPHFRPAILSTGRLQTASQPVQDNAVLQVIRHDGGVCMCVCVHRLI